MSSEQYINLLLKKIQGVPFTSSTITPDFEGAGSSLFNVQQNNILAQNIPINAPFNKSTLGLTISYPTGSIEGGIKYILPGSYSYIVYYEKLTLKAKQYQLSFFYSGTLDSDIVGTNLLIGAIPSNQDPAKNTYAIIVYNGSTIVPANTYYFDTASGYLTFFTPITWTPTISFWRYEGTKGANLIGLTSLNGNIGISNKNPTTELHVTGTTISDYLTITNSISTASLNVTGNTTVNGNINTSSNLMVYGDVKVNGNIISNGGNTNLYDLIINPPPAIVFGTPVSTSTSIFIPWTYPTQVNVGILNLYLPVINSFTCTWSGKINGTVKTNQSILTDVTTSAVLKYNNLTLNSSYITGIVLTNIISNAGYKSIHFPQDPSGINRYAYVAYSADFTNLQTDLSNNNLKAWYSNNNTSSNINSVNFDIFVLSGVPSVTGAPIFGTQSNTSNIISVPVSCSVPTFNDISNTTSDAIIQNYKFTYSSIGSETRYGGPVAHTSVTIIDSSNTNIQISNLYPDCSYTFYAQAQNNSTNSNYGTLSIGSILFTTYINPTASFGSILFTQSVTTYTAKLVSSGSSVSNILFTAPSFPWTSSLFISPIHTVSNRSSTAANLLSITGTIYGGSTQLATSSINYGGFGVSTPSDLTSTYFSIIAGTPIDSYSSSNTYNQGFYLQTTTSIQLNSQLFNNSSNQQITISVTQINDTSNNSSYSFYYDNYSLTPSFTSFTIALKTLTFTQISGIFIVGGDITLYGNTVVNNIGNYFYNNNQILSYNNSTGTKEIDGTNITSGKYDISFNSQVTFNNPSITHNISSFMKSFNLSVTAYSPNNNTATTTSNNLNIIFDTPSYNLLNTYDTYPTSINTTGIGLTIINGIFSLLVTGFRISSQTIASGTNIYSLPPSSAYATTIYNNTTSISTNSDLQIFNGKYQTKGSSSNGYLNYITYYSSVNTYNGLNYSGILASGYRYATFAWKINTYASNYTKVQFQIYDMDYTVNNPDSLPIVGSTRLYLYYRIEDGSNYSSFNASYKNTTWIDINSTDNAISVGNYFNTTNNNILGGKNTDIVYADSFSNNTYTVNGLLPSFSVGSSETIYLYFRIAAPMNKNFNFSNVKAQLF